MGSQSLWVSSLIYCCTGLLKSNQELQVEQAKCLHWQVIFIISVLVINQNVICTLAWDTQRGSVHKNNMIYLSFQKEMCCFTRWQYHAPFVALSWSVAVFFFQKYIFMTKWVHSVRQGSCWQVGKEKRGIMQTFRSVNVRTTQLYVCSGEFSSSGECSSKK